MRRPLERTLLGILFLFVPLVVCAIGAAVAYHYYPATKPVTAKALVLSVADEVGAPEPPGYERCDKKGEDWTCSVPDSDGSGSPTTYRVSMEDDHCWRARKTKAGVEGGDYADHPQGCVGFRHQGGLVEQIF